MSMDQPPLYENSPGFSPDSPRPGMSTGSKVLLVLGIIFLVMILLCCGGVLTVGYMGQRYMEKSVSEDPQVVRQVTAEIAEVDIPEGLEPAFSMDMKVPFTGQPAVAWVVYRDQPSDSMLMLSSFGEVVDSTNREQLQAQMLQSMHEQGLSQEETTGPREVSERQITVSGTPETFTFITSKAPETDQPRLEVSGAFTGPRGGLVLFLFNGDAEKFPEAEIVSVLESIQ
ncbi:MAG: hypothetical protein U1E05_24070 [Patescibacteria group bacterium]|nr:hypothetical protein [Patescibacteria group bacterium]